MRDDLARDLAPRQHIADEGTGVDDHAEHGLPAGLFAGFLDDRQYLLVAEARVPLCVPRGRGLQRLEERLPFLLQPLELLVVAQVDDGCLRTAKGLDNVRRPISRTASNTSVRRCRRSVVPIRLSTTHLLRGT